MTDIWLKRQGNMLVPCDDEGLEYVKKLSQGKQVKAKITRPRNIKFHRRFFAMLDYVYDVWEPEDVEVPQYMVVRGMVPEKNRERFRKDMICLAGFSEAVINLNGDARLEAKSMAFGNMGEDEFNELYNKVVDVAIKKISALNMTEEELKITIDGLLEFA